MARSDGHGARPGHPAPPRPGHQLDQPAAPHYGTDQPAGWPDSRDFGSQYPQEPYWQQPAAPQGYQPAEPAYPSSPDGLGYPIEPVAPDPRYAGQPQHNPYAGGQDAYHYPQEPGFDPPSFDPPGFDPYEPASPPHLRAPNPGSRAPEFGAPEFPPFQEPASTGYPLPHGYAQQQQDDYGTQYDSQYPPAREPHLNQYQPQSGGGQFQDYMDQAPPLAEQQRAPGYSDLNQNARFGNERSALRGSDFEDWPRADGAHDQGQAGYDTSSQFGPAAAAHGGYAEQGWQQQDNSFPLDSGPIFASAGYDTAQDLALHSEYDDDEYDEAEEEPVGRSRGARIGWILMALAGAVMIGGSLAYGYKILLGPAATQVADTPVVKSMSEPPKVRPEDPGGRNFDHTDSKVLGRLSEQRNAANNDALADDGSRRVSTVVIGRDGDILAPRTAPTPSATPPANPVVTVPGLTLVDGFGGRPPVTPANAPQQPIVVQPPASNNASSSKPVVTTRSGPATRDIDAAAPPPPTKPAERVTARTAALAPPKASPPVTTASTTPPAAESAGYVAVLASVPVSATSRVDALAQYADIQQSYSSVLRSRTPDVREANLGSRGRYHRLMVGPPGSKESAADLCAELKTAGYSGCWITTY